MLARSCAAAVAAAGKATERFIVRRGDGGVAWGVASAGLGVGVGVADGVTPGKAGGGGGGDEEALPASEGGGGGGGDCDCERDDGVPETGDTLLSCRLGAAASAGVAVGTAGEAVASAAGVEAGSEGAGAGEAGIVVPVSAAPFTGAASAGKDGEVVAGAAAEGAGVTSDAGEGDGRLPTPAGSVLGDAVGAVGETDPGARVTRLSRI